MTKKPKAFTVVELLIIIAVLSVITAVLLPMLARSHHHTSFISCINNLKQIGLSFKTYSIDNNDRYPMESAATGDAVIDYSSSDMPWKIFQVMSNELSTPKILICSLDKSRNYATNFTSDLNNSRISYFVNLSAKEGGTNALLSGDRNLLVDAKPAKGLSVLNTNSIVSWTTDLHQKGGNILMNDGSVHETANPALQAIIVNMPQPARLALP